MLEAFAASFASVFSAIYDDGTLHVPTRSEGNDGDVTVTFTGDDGQPAGTPIKGQVNQLTEAMRQAAGYTATQQQLIVLQAGVTRVSTDYEITLGGVRWKIAAVEADPLNSHWILRGERA